MRSTSTTLGPTVRLARCRPGRRFGVGAENDVRTVGRPDEVLDSLGGIGDLTGLTSVGVDDPYLAGFSGTHGPQKGQQFAVGRKTWPAVGVALGEITRSRVVLPGQQQARAVFGGRTRPLHP